MAVLTTPTFNVNSVSYNSISLANIQSENAAGFMVRWSLSGQDSWTELSCEGPTYTITGLVGATAYDVQVKAVGDGVDYEDSGWSESETVSTLTRLNPPSNVVATVVDRTTIRVSGVQTANASGYEVRIGTLSGGLPSFKVTPVNGVVEFDRRAPRSVYYISVRALGDDEVYDASEWTNEISVLTGQVIDEELTVPAFSISTSGTTFTEFTIAGMTIRQEYRYQIATTEAGLESALPRCFGSSTGNSYIGNLEPGTTYYMRFCTVEKDKCSLWSDVLSATTTAYTTTVTVTSGADSGTGTLREAITNASGNTRILLDVDTITLNSVISSTKRLYIVGNKINRTVIQPGNSNALFTLQWGDVKHCKFTGNTGANKCIINAGRYIDCVFEGLETTAAANLVTARLYNCTITGNVGGLGVVGGASVFDSVFYNNRSTGHGGAIDSSLVVNCLILNNTAAGTAGGCNSSTLFNCAVIGNSALGELSNSGSGGGCYYSSCISCTITNNTGKGGGLHGTTSHIAKNCYIADNYSTIHGGGVYGLTCEDCIITRNTAYEYGGGSRGGSYTNCIVSENKALSMDGGGIYAAGTVTDCTITKNRAARYGGGLNACTTATNCLIAENYAGSSGGGVNGGTCTDCIIRANTSSGVGGVTSSTCVRCVIEQNVSGSGSTGGVNGGSCTDCIIRDNTGGSLGGAANGSILTRCLITGNNDTNISTATANGGVIRGGEIYNCIITDNETYCAYGIGVSFTGVIRDSLIIGNRNRYSGISNTQVYLLNKNGSYIANSTTGYINGYSFGTNGNVWNTLCAGIYPSPASASNNINYSGNASAYFVDPENGDYRLKPGCNAIEAGSNSYVNEGETDLAGNPRIAGTNVDVGAYEFTPLPLPTPTLNLETGYNTATIYFTLPDYCSSYEIEYAHNADFTNSGTATASTTGFVLPGLSGDTYIRARYKGVSGHTLDSEWSEVVYHYFDTTAPTVVQSTETLIMTVNTTVDFTSGMTVSDDHDPNVIPYYEVLDSNDDPIEVNGETHNIPSSSLAVGIYTLRFTATDAANNTGISTRPLEVRPPVLPTPTISFYTSSTDSITVAGLTEQFAEGWTVNVNGTNSTAEPDANGRLVIDGLRVTNVYEIKVMALGNGITTGDSEWSNVVTASPSPAIIAYSDIHIANQPTGQYSAVRKADLNERVPTGGQKGEVIVWGDDGPEWTPGIIPIVRVIR